MNNIAIIHFAPLELYPPVQNLLKEFQNHGSNGRTVIVLTTRTVGLRLQPIISSSKNVKIVRCGKSGQSMSVFVRYANYLRFYTLSLIALLKYHPKKILYFETLSSFPAYLYKRFVSGRCSIYIHYHEYTTPQEYRNGMFLGRFFHKLERWLYKSASWISHTNQFRMDRFKDDMLPTMLPNTFVLPNFPPREWHAPPVRKEDNESLKIVYVGALSMDTMYTLEFANWILSQKGDVTWDIYSYNYDIHAATFLKELDSPWIQLKAGVDYAALPCVLRRYDIGVILYKGHIPNYLYNAPNKLFEYMACGLDVWFPEVMRGSLAYVRENSRPRVIAIDFTKLNQFRVPVMSDDLDIGRQTYFSEDALKDIICKLTEND